MTIKGAATTAGTERMTREGYTSLVKGGGKVQNESQKNINDRKDLASYTNRGYEQAYKKAMTIQSANVSAGKVILCTVAADGTNSDHAISVTIKYHLK